jgi:chromate reductase, NAD(P)H dehydrogenase (quinone)
MTRIIGISGSLRQGSYNLALLRNAAELVPAGCTLEIASIKDIPLYDGDLEAQSGIPAAVAALKERVAAADGLLLVTPEYNNSIPGVFKNAVDWMTRPASDIARVFGDRPVGLIGATPGGMGTTFAQTAWLPVLRTLGTRPFFGKTLYVSGAGKVFDAEGRLTDKDLRERLRVYMGQFAAFVASTRAATKPAQG